MKQRSLHTIIAFRFALIVLVVVAATSLISNYQISCQFQCYVEAQQKSAADRIAQNISSQYSTQEGGWNIDYIHGMGMYALEDGFIIKLYDPDKNVLWDAENHDMTLCQDMMQTITIRMQEQHPTQEGDFVTDSYELKKDGTLVGYLDIGYYRSYYMDENDFQFLAALNRILLVIGSVSVAGAVLMGIVT